MTYDGFNASDIIRRIREIETAKAAVAPYCGNLTMDADSVADVYTNAMRHMGYTVPRELIGQDAAARSLFNAIKGFRPRPSLAQDTNIAAARTEMFPNANRLSRGF